MKILTVLGARPQFIKAGAVSRAILAAGIPEVIVHTGQHFDYNMSQVFFDQMEIPLPDYNLDIHGLSHGAMTGRMLEAIEKVLLQEKPDLVLVYGDTNSTLAGALAAQKLGIPVAHVEAGLRSFNMAMPEETNRILTDRISSVLFCPTDIAVSNLKAEGFDNFGCTVLQTGDVMLDAAMYYGQYSHLKSSIIKDLKLTGSFVLGTVHRQENTNNENNLRGIVEALNIIHGDMPVVVPLHPRTQKQISNLGLRVDFSVISPVGYFDMLELLKHCSLVLTDSGGLQKEAFFFGKSCLILRHETEWVELVEGGFNTLAGPEKQKIINEFRKMVMNHPDFSATLYGSGDASSQIVEYIRKSY